MKIDKIMPGTIATIVLLLTTGFLYGQGDPPNGLKKGDLAPTFNGINQYGDSISLAELVNKGKVILFFYRGHWCPYCNKHLSQLQDSLQLILDKGASVIAITPENSEYIEKTTSKTGATFNILYDQGHQIMDAYKVSFQEKKSKAKSYKIFLGGDLEKAHGDSDYILPVPATYIIGSDGKISYVHFDTDYKKRATVTEIINQL